jgi:hypothetical protein
MWFETEPDHGTVSTVYFRSVERERLDTYHFGVYAIAEAGGATAHLVYEFYGDFAAAASKLREEVIQQLIGQAKPLSR